MLSPSQVFKKSISELADDMINVIDHHLSTNKVITASVNVHTGTTPIKVALLTMPLEDVSFQLFQLANDKLKAHDWQFYTVHCGNANNYLKHSIPFTHPRPILTVPDNEALVIITPNNHHYPALFKLPTNAIEVNQTHEQLLSISQRGLDGKPVISPHTDMDDSPISEPVNSARSLNTTAWANPEALEDILKDWGDDNGIVINSINYELWFDPDTNLQHLVAKSDPEPHWIKIGKEHFNLQSAIVD